MSPLHTALSALMLVGCSLSAEVKIDSRPIDAAIEEISPEAIVSVPVVEHPKELASRHILIIGDSEACAIGAVVKKEAARITDSRNEPRDQISVVCKAGTRVEYWSSGKFSAALQRHPDVDTVLVFLGTNHYGSRRVPNVVPILDEVDNRQLTCIWSGNTAVHGKSWPMNEILKTAVSPDCDYFDTESLKIDLADGIHPTTQGAVAWVDALWDRLPLKYEEEYD